MPHGKRSVSPLVRRAIAELMAAVSSVVPLPVAPKSVTLIVVGVVAAPVPDRATVAGELAALLTIVRVPVTLPEATGANATLNVALWPGLKVKGRGNCVMENSLTETEAWETVKVELPEFVRAMVFVSVAPITTFPKLRLAGTIEI